MTRGIGVLMVLLVVGCASPDKVSVDPSGSGGGTGTGSGTGTACYPNCAGRECGTDGCGGTCGTCQPGETCGDDALCTSGDCLRECSGKNCGPDGCGGFCGVCPAGTACNGAGQCTDGGGSGCLPKCANKECGDDGCGNQCGKCAAGSICGAAGHCEADTTQCLGVGDQGECQQSGTIAVSCKAGKLVAVVCDPALGLKCGFNPTKNKYDCIKEGCTPSCVGKECGTDGCGGLCGHCDTSEICNADGQCQADTGCVPKCSGKICGPNGCGGQCGICAPNEQCTPTGTCIDPSGCTAQCGGKACGADGCGGTCGTCKPTEKCQSGACVEGSCTPSCAGKDCGSDGCGGTCGGCPSGQSCDAAGHCVTVAAGCGNLTYEGKCDANDVVVSWCEGGQVKTQDCSQYGAGFQCAWDAANAYYWCLQGCTPACTGKTCGPDGCGGSCGSCPAGQACGAGGQCGSGGACGGVTAAGICEGDTLTFCSNGQVKTVGCGQVGKSCGLVPGTGAQGCVEPVGCTPNCLSEAGTPRVCGDDGCGTVCGVCGAGQSCQDGVCGAGADACGGITVAGTCEGTVLKFCAGGTLSIQDCAQVSKACGWDAAGNGGAGWFDCMEGGGSRGTACGQVTARGVCVGNTLTYCGAQGTLQSLDCPTFGDLACLYNPSDRGGAGGYDCLEPPTCPACPADQRCQMDGTCGCDGVTLEGHCEGDTLVYCQETQLVTQACGAGKCSIGTDGWAWCL